MELRDAIRRRRMVRNYDPDRPVAREQVDGLLELAIRAPSAGFSQGWRFLVLDQPDAVARFWAATSARRPGRRRWLTGMSRAPALIIALSDKAIYLDRYAEPDKGWTDRDEARWPVPYWHIDTGMAALLILLGAVDAGSGAAACSACRASAGTRCGPRSRSRPGSIRSPRSAWATPRPDRPLTVAAPRPSASRRGRRAYNRF